MGQPGERCSILDLRFGWLLVLSLHKQDHLQFFNVCPFDYTVVAVSGKVECSLTGLTTPITKMMSVTSAIESIVGAATAV